jgi:hypothetical protein
MPFPTASPAAAPPPAPVPDATGGGGDGFNHYVLDQNETGFHSVHTGPDGQVTEADPATPDEAAQNMQQCMGGGEPDADDSTPADDMGGAPDFSAAYSK